MVVLDNIRLNWTNIDIANAYVKWDDVRKIQHLTLAEYEALTEKDNNTIYVVSGKWEWWAYREYKAWENITISNDWTISATDTTYTPWNGIKIDDWVMSVDSSVAWWSSFWALVNNRHKWKTFTKVKTFTQDDEDGSYTMKKPWFVMINWKWSSGASAASSYQCNINNFNVMWLSRSTIYQECHKEYFLEAWDVISYSYYNNKICATLSIEIYEEQ